MNNTLKASMDMIRAIKGAAQIKGSRNFADFFTDRLVIAATEPTLAAFFERLMKLLDCDTTYIGGDVVAVGLAACAKDDAGAVLAWIRANPRIASLLAFLRDQQDYINAITGIEITPMEASGVALQRAALDTTITATCMAPLAHGADGKAGNATLFRRCQVLSTTGAVLTLPFYAGNAVRGQMRDLLADHFLRSLGIVARRDKPAINLWFFHALYAGGALDDGKQTKEISKRLGAAGSVRAEGLHEFKDMLPGLSALGCAIGNRIIPGACQVADLVPDCVEWGTGDIAAAQLMEWTFLTRREDHQGHSDDDNSSMIANTECLRLGTVLRGGLTISGHATELERSAIGRGLLLLQSVGYLGAESRRGFGRVAMDIANAPAPDAYDAHLAEHKDAIITYLRNINAIPQGGIDNARNDTTGAGDTLL